MLSPRSDTVVLIPIRSFDDTKSRLADSLSPEERRELSMWMAAGVIGAAGDLPTRVVTDDAAVAAWARQLAAEVFAVGAAGLNPSVTAAVVRAAEIGFGRAIIAHGDLPSATDLRMVDRPGVCIAPDRRHEGSNVMSVPTDAGFTFAYGPDSFTRHCAEAHRLGLALSIVEDDSLAWDIDDPSDLPENWRAMIREQEQH